MFNPVLRKRGKNKLIYSTSMGFRIIFMAIALIIILSIASVAGKSFFQQINFFALVLILICLFAALYLERWVFDKKTNVFEKNVGIIFFFTRKKRTLDTLRKVVLHEPGVKYDDRPKMLRIMSRRSAILSVVDQEGNVYGLDMAKGGSVKEARKTAEELSAFCGIPLEDTLGNLSTSTNP